MVKITFLNPYVLWALFSIPLMIALHFFLLKYTRRKSMIFANFETMKRVTGEIILSKNLLLLIMRLTILILLILSASGMILWYSGRVTDFNYVIALDTSSSMLADDFTPSRLAVARETANEFIDGISANAKVGLVTFAGTSFLAEPLTTDFNKLTRTIDELKISEVGGTDLGEAIVTSTNALLSDDKPGIVILLTDGQSTVGTPFEDGVAFAVDKHVTVYTVGIATEAGGSFVNVPLISRIDEKSLGYIASNTGGRFFPAESRDALRTAFKEISASQKSEVPIHLSFIFLVVGLILLFGEWALINTKYRTLP